MNFLVIIAVIILVLLVSLVVRRTMEAKPFDSPAKARRLPVIIMNAARKIVRQTDNAFQANHIFSRVEAQNFQWLTRSFYDQARRDAEANGFSWLADIEDKTLSQVYPNLRTFVRILLGPDYRTRFAIFEIVPGGPTGERTSAPVQTRQLISEASDGVTIITSATQASKQLNRPPGVVVCEVPADAPMNTMLDSHQQVVDDYLNTHWGVSLGEIRDFNEATAAWQKGIDRQRAWLKAQGGISQEEMVRIGGKRREKLAIAVHKEMSKIEQDK